MDAGALTPRRASAFSARRTALPAGGAIRARRRRITGAPAARVIPPSEHASTEPCFLLREEARARPRSPGAAKHRPSAISPTVDYPASGTRQRPPLPSCMERGSAIAIDEPPHLANYLTPEGAARPGATSGTGSVLEGDEPLNRCPRPVLPVIRTTLTDIAVERLRIVNMQGLDNRGRQARTDIYK